MTLYTGIIMDNMMWLRLEGVYTMTAVAVSVQGCGLLIEQMKINQI